MLEANQVDGIISGSHNLGISDYDRVTAPIISFDRNLSPLLSLLYLRTTMLVEPWLQKHWSNLEPKRSL